MTNAFEGIQFRSRRNTFVSFNEDPYEDWQDMPIFWATKVFPSGTQIRVTPVVQFEVLAHGFGENFTEIFMTKTKAIERASKMLSDGKNVSIKVVDKTPDITTQLFNRNVQFCAVGTEVWRSINYINLDNITGPITFRVRPDHHFQVVFSNPLQNATIDFDDVDRLAKYVESKIRTGTYNFTVKAIKYDV